MLSLVRGKLTEPRLDSDRQGFRIVANSGFGNHISSTQHHAPIATLICVLFDFLRSADILRCPSSPKYPSCRVSPPSRCPIMGAWSYVRSIYALDTIDTRFTSSASTPHRAVADARAESARSSSKKDGASRGAPARPDSSLVQPSRWNTPEFYFYYFVFITVIPYMFWITYDVSRRECDCNWLFCNI